MAKVLVYRFTKYDITTDEHIQSKRMATLEGVARVDGALVEGSGVEIDESRLCAKELGQLTEINFIP